MRILAIVLASIGIVAQAAAPPPFAPDQRIKAKGEFSARTIRAHSVQLKDPNDRDFELVGRVEALEGERIRVHGIWAEIDEGRVSRRARQLWRRLEIGDWVKVEGEWRGDERFVADTFERPRKKRRVDSVEGVVSTLPSKEGLWWVGPFSVETSAETVWKGFE